MPLVDLVHAFKKAIPSWDPAKHPRDRDGRFIEVGDLVRAYESKESLEPEVVGRVHASYLAPDGRMFIGVESYGYVRWYRPKQLEHVKVKATLGKEKAPDLPLPTVDEKYDEVFWQNDEAFKKLGSEVEEALYDESATDLTLKKSDLDGEFLEMAGLGGDSPAPSSVPQADEVVIPAGKTPDDLLRMVATSYDNKIKGGSIGPYDYSDDGSSAWHSDFEDMLGDPEFKSASQKLSKLMTAAKLGGKQRKRYNSILAQKYGGHQVAEFTPADDDELVTVQEATSDPGYPIPAPLADWEAELLEIANPTPEGSISVGAAESVDLPYDDSIVDPDMVKLFKKSLDAGMFAGVEQVVQEGSGGPTNWNPSQVESAKAALYEYGGASAIPSSGPIPPVPPKPDEIDPVWFSVADSMAPNSVLYQHPQGSILISYPSSETVVKYSASGKKVATSATFAKLASGGHGQWSTVGTGPDALIQLKESMLAPSSAPAPSQAADQDTLAAEQTAATPSIDKSQDEVLLLLKTSMQNKGLGGTWDDLHDKFNDLLNAGGYGTALPKLNALMTAAKLGGKQRKRYKDALAAKYGQGPLAAPTGKGKGLSGPDSWLPLIPSNSTSPMGPTPTGVVGPAKGNTLVNPPATDPKVAKATIQEQLSTRMRGKVSLDQLTAAILESKFDYGSAFAVLATQARKYGASGGIGSGDVLLKNTHGMWSVQNAATSPSGKVKISNPSAADWERAMLETVANSLVGQWAGTSNDNNARSLALQQAAVEEFGLKDTYTWPTSMSLMNDTKLELNKHRALYRTFLREMYNNTQEWAKQNGVKTVRLRRGSGMHAGTLGSVTNARLRPMSSFSTDYNVAAGFGGHRIEAYVPIEWVVGNAATGYGCQNEYEWVVLGGVHKVRVIQ